MHTLDIGYHFFARSFIKLLEYCTLKESSHFWPIFQVPFDEHLRFFSYIVKIVGGKACFYSGYFRMCVVE